MSKVHTTIKIATSKKSEVSFDFIFEVAIEHFKKRRIAIMIVLAFFALALFLYLGYVLLKPEKF